MSIDKLFVGLRSEAPNETARPGIVSRKDPLQRFGAATDGLREARWPAACRVALDCLGLLPRFSGFYPQPLPRRESSFDLNSQSPSPAVRKHLQTSLRCRSRGSPGGRPARQHGRREAPHHGLHRSNKISPPIVQQSASESVMENPEYNLATRLSAVRHRSAPRLPARPRRAARHPARRAVPDRLSARRGGERAARSHRPRSRLGRPRHQLTFLFRQCRRQCADLERDNADAAPRVGCRHAPRTSARRGFNPRNFNLGHKLRLVDGEHHVFGDGSVVCLPTEGHTPGHQSLRLRLDSARSCSQRMPAISAKPCESAACRATCTTAR